MNGAFEDLLIHARPWLITKLAGRLADHRGSGPERLLDEAEDLLNEILLLLFRKSGGFRGTTEAEAVGWLGAITNRIILDAVKTPWRRNKVWKATERLFRSRQKLRDGGHLELTTGPSSEDS
jgi:DNA-directed RNA polymerase specialized sigma24 family protein